MRKELFDDLVKGKMDQHASQVPADAWDNIRRKDKRRRGILFFTLAGLLFGGVLISIGIIHNQETQNHAFERKKSDHKRDTDSPTSASNSNRKNIVQHVDSTRPINVVNDVKATTNGHVATKKTSITIARKSGGRGIAAYRPITAKHSQATLYLNGSRKIPSSSEDNYNSSPILRRHNTKTDIDEIFSPGIVTTTTTKAGTGAIATSSVAADGIDRAIEGSVDSTSKTEIAMKCLTGKQDSMITPVLAIAGAKDTQKKKESKAWLKGLFADAGGSIFYTMAPTPGTIPVLRISNSPMKKEEYRADQVSSHLLPGYSYSIALRKKISRKWQLGIGLQYTGIKEELTLSGTETTTTYSPVYRLGTGPSLVSDTTVVTSTGHRVIQARNSYTFFSIPVFAQYLLATKRSWTISATGGLSLNKPGQYKNSIDGKPQPVSGSSVHSASLTVDVQAGLRIDKFIGRRYGIYATPYFQYDAMNYRLPELATRKYMHRAGLSLGLSYKLQQR